MTNQEAINILINTIQPPIIRNDGKSWAHLLALEAIQKAVIALEVADVVRCKDCKWYYEKGAFCDYWAGVCEHAEAYPRITPIDFCSRAKRKEVEE